MKALPSLCAALSALLLAAPAPAGDAAAGDIRVTGARAFETAGHAMVGGGYFTVANTGASPERLLAVIADFPRVEMHATTEADGIARMGPVETVEIGPGETVEFAPGGLHVMFMGLDGDPFDVGETIPARLRFERAGEVAITFEVVPRAAGAGILMDHGMTPGGHGAAPAARP